MKRNGLIHKALKAKRESDTYAKHSWAKVKTALLGLDESLLPQDTVVSADHFGIYVYVVWGLDNLQSARQAIGDGWELQSQNDSSNGNMYRHYYHRTLFVSLTLVLDATRVDPGTCQRIKVGEKTVTQDIYKIVCT